MLFLGHSSERVHDPLSGTQAEMLSSSQRSPYPPSLTFWVDNSYFMESKQHKMELQKFLGVAMYHT